MNPQNSFTRDYRLKEHGRLLQMPEKQGGWLNDQASQDSLNGDLPSWWLVIPFIFITLFASWALIWSLYMVMHADDLTPIAAYHTATPSSEYNNEYAAFALSPTAITSRGSEPLPEENGLSSPSVSATVPARVSSSTDSPIAVEGAFYSQTSELLELSGVLNKPAVNDGWED